MKARADVVGAVMRDEGRAAMVDIKGGTGGMNVVPEQDVGGGFAFAVEYPDLQASPHHPLTMDLLQLHSPSQNAILYLL